MRIFNTINANPRHKLGNLVSGLCNILDGLIIVLTIGNINSNLTLTWNMYRRSTGVLSDSKIDKKNSNYE